MFDFLAEIADAIWTGVKGLWTTCKRIIKATISFVHDILDGLFDILEEIFDGDVPDSVGESPVKPFVADMDKLIDGAPISDQGLFKQKKKNLTKGFYDTRTGEILNPTYIAGDQVDQKTKDIMNEEPIVIIG